MDNVHRQQRLMKHQHSADNGVKAEAPSGQLKVARTHNELHRELLLAHKRGLALSRRSELQQALERRKRLQSDREERDQVRTPLEDELLRRQQKQHQSERERGEAAAAAVAVVREEAQLMEFVRVRQNLRKIHSAIQSRAAEPSRAAEESRRCED